MSHNGQFEFDPRGLNGRPVRCQIGAASVRRNKRNSPTGFFSHVSKRHSAIDNARHINLYPRQILTLMQPEQHPRVIVGGHLRGRVCGFCLRGFYGDLLIRRFSMRLVVMAVIFYKKLCRIGQKGHGMMHRRSRTGEISIVIAGVFFT